MSFLHFNVRDFGAKGDGVTDDWAAFQAALVVMKNAPPDRDASGGGVLLIPAGNYFLSKTLVLTHRVELLGITGRDGYNALGYTFSIDAVGNVHHAIGLPGAMSRLLFPAGVTGIKVALGGLGKGAPHAGIAEDASSSIIRNICLQAADRSSYDTHCPQDFGHGLSIKTKVIIDNCFIFNFAGNGLHFVAPSNPSLYPNGAAFYDVKHPQLGDLYQQNSYIFEVTQAENDTIRKDPKNPYIDPTPSPHPFVLPECNPVPSPYNPITDRYKVLYQYNANTINSQISNVFSFNNLLNGVYIIGSNSGDMLLQGIHCKENGRYGFFDAERATGNTYVNCYSESNGAGDYYHFGSGLEKKPDSTYHIAGKAGSGSLYLNCYQETAQSTVYSPATILEGQLGLEGYNRTPVDREFQANYLSLTGRVFDDVNFTGRGRPSIIRQGTSQASTDMPFGVHVYGGDQFVIVFGGCLVYPDGAGSKIVLKMASVALKLAGTIKKEFYVVFDPGASGLPVGSIFKPTDMTLLEECPAGTTTPSTDWSASYRLGVTGQLIYCHSVYDNSVSPNRLLFTLCVDEEGAIVPGFDWQNAEPAPGAPATVSVDLGGARSATALTLYSDLKRSVLPLRLYLDDEPSQWWSFSNGTDLPPLRISIANSKWDKADSIQADDNQIWLQKGLFLGKLHHDPPGTYAGRPIFVGSADAKPTDTGPTPPLGGWQTGDVAWNINPSPANADVSKTYAGWMCTLPARGTNPSSWAGFGKLEALP
jgi:Pectate lyase superfamily protein